MHICLYAHNFFFVEHKGNEEKYVVLNAGVRKVARVF